MQCYWKECWYWECEQYWVIGSCSVLQVESIMVSLRMQNILSSSEFTVVPEAGHHLEAFLPSLPWLHVSLEVSWVIYTCNMPGLGGMTFEQTQWQEYVIWWNYHHSMSSLGNTWVAALHSTILDFHFMYTIVLRTHCERCLLRVLQCGNPGK